MSDEIRIRKLVRMEMNAIGNQLQDVRKELSWIRSATTTGLVGLERQVSKISSALNELQSKGAD